MRALRPALPAGAGPAVSPGRDHLSHAPALRGGYKRLFGGQEVQRGSAGYATEKKKKIGVQSLFLIITSFNGDIIHFGFIIIKRILTVLQHLLLLGD